MFKQSQTTSRRGKFFRVAGVIFVILIVALTLAGIAPTPVKELNNFFFSIFIAKDEVPKDLEEKINTAPNVSVFVTKTESGQVTKPKPVTIRTFNSSGAPTVMRIPKINTETTILNPISEEAAVLDAALLRGAVLYPTSGTLAYENTIFLFGHSSYLPVVHNQNFKAFNEIQKLIPGDSVFLSDGEMEYEYKVTEVNKTKAEDAVITIKNDKGLVLSTCDSFASKDDRFVVYTSFVRSYSLGS